MTFTSKGLPNNGRTTHYEVGYDDALAAPNGLNLAAAILPVVEADYAVMQGWFPGVKPGFPTQLFITGRSGGAEWQDTAQATLKPGSNPTTTLLRYLIVSEVTEMFMQAQGQGWFEGWYGDEGSRGESLSRFLAAEFVVRYCFATAVPAGFTVCPNWLNDTTRPNFIDVSVDVNKPNNVTGCGTNFLFYLHHQLGYTIEEIVASGGATLATVYRKLTGLSDGWQAFHDLTDLHFPTTLTSYRAPADNFFPVSNFDFLEVPSPVSWVTNWIPNEGMIVLDRPAPTNLPIDLTSDDRTVLDFAAFPGDTFANGRLLLKSHAFFRLVVPPQPAQFVNQIVTVTSSYAGTTQALKVSVVRPEDLPVDPLAITSSELSGDPCSQRFVEHTSTTVSVSNLAKAFREANRVAVKWYVDGAFEGAGPELVLSLPTAGTHLTVRVEAATPEGLRSGGSLDITTVAQDLSMNEIVGYLTCVAQRYRAINVHIPPWVPIENILDTADPVELDTFETQLLSIAQAVQTVAAKVAEKRQQLQ